MLPYESTTITFVPRLIGESDADYLKRVADAHDLNYLTHDDGRPFAIAAAVIIAMIALTAVALLTYLYLTT